jgi:hypothetical protein
MEIAEQRMTEAGYLTQGKLTMFDGIPFDQDNPYAYHEAKRRLKLAMDELRRHKGLHRMGMDPKLPGRTAITGRDDTSVWDFLRLRQSRKANNHTAYPHLTVAIQRERVLVIVIIPNGIKAAFRRNLVSLGKEQFFRTILQVEKGLRGALSKDGQAQPFAEAVQRHYPTQRSAPVQDARLEFDLRTASPSDRGPKRARGGVKHQPQWLEMMFDALAAKRSNIQLAIGALFPYTAKVLKTAACIESFARVWVACDPLLRVLLGDEYDRRRQH